MLSVVHRLKIFRTKFSPMINLIHTGLLTYICLFVYVYVFFLWHLCFLLHRNH